MSKAALDPRKTLRLGSRFDPYKQHPGEQRRRERPPAPLGFLASFLLGNNLDLDEFEDEPDPYAAALAKMKARGNGTLVDILKLKPPDNVVSTVSDGLTMSDATEAMLADLPKEILTRGEEMLEKAIDSGSGDVLRFLLTAGGNPDKYVPGTKETLYDYGKRTGNGEINDTLDVWYRSRAK